MTKDIGGTWRWLVGDSQLRWIGPEKGVIHLALGAAVNALWDLWAKSENKPVWKLVTDFTPEEFVRAIDFRYITDALTPEEAIEMLRNAEEGKQQRLQDALNDRAVPAYTTAAGWLGYSDEKMTGLLKDTMSKGYKHFKLKVGRDMQDDKRRLALARQVVGEEAVLMIDSNQIWSVPDAIEYVKQLAEYKLWFIEEPTSPDDILGHLAIKKALEPYGIKVATGEMCQNRVIFKQLLASGAIDICQIDACRLGGVNEVLAVLLLANKYNIPVVPHSGGVGLPEYTQHLSTIDYVCVSGKLSLLEYVEHFNKNFKYPSLVKDGYIITPTEPGYSAEATDEAVETYQFPKGKFWNSPESDHISSKVLLDFHR